MKKNLIIFILSVFITGGLLAQVRVTGKVTNNSGEPIPGVNVLIKGTNEGAITDLDGRYILPDVNSEATLVFSFTGMLMEEAEVGNRTEIDMILIDDILALDELVVIGYGTQTKRFVTGSVSSVDMEEIKTISPITNVTQVLGEVAGMQFLNNGRPGQGGTLLLRGKNSLATNTDPLIVIDGIIFEGSLSDINPQDIKTIDVLKDAASAAIYGAKAANGVVMITSNKGRSFKPMIRVNATYGISEAERWLNMPTKEEYIQRKRDFYTQQLEVAGNDYGVDINDVSKLLKPEEYENDSVGKFMSFEDLVGRQGKLSTFDLSVSGGSENTSYLFSVSVNEDIGLIKGDKENKVSFRMNLESKVTDWLTFGTASFFTHRDLSGVVADLSDAYDNSPFGTFYYPDGNVKYTPVTSEASVFNSLYLYELTDNKETRKNM
ncbi:MAG: TonB-dependent receptor plug domain-containing protein, partial [Bacteroidales bacterium]